jgi:predicted RNA methylase
MTKQTPRPQPTLLTTDLFGSYRAPEAKKKGKTAAPQPEAAQPAPHDPALTAFAMPSTPGLAPAPSTLPYGVEALPSATDAARVQANTLARQIVDAEGELTDMARDALRQYSGEGGLGGSTNAFYTPTSLVDLTWQVARELGPTTRTLEFSCGGGAFLSRAPQGTLLVGVELDETTAKVAQALHPHVHVWNASFETYHTRSEDQPFDLVIGNPPFGVRGATAVIDRPRLTQAHWYFVLAGLERVAPGGLMAVIVPESMLRNPSEQAAREQVLDRAHLLTASAIPGGAFTATGAGVTTALLILRRHDAGVTEALAVLTPEEQQRVRDARLSSDDGLNQFVQGSVLFMPTQDGWSLRHTFTSLGAPWHHAKIRSGRFGDPEYAGAVDASRVEDLIKQASARRSGVLTHTGLLALIQTLCGPGTERRARAARAQAHPIRDGTESPCRSFVFRRGQWTYGHHLADPATLSALGVAQAITAARSALRTQAANAAAARDQAMQAHASHHAAYGAYDVAQLARAAKVAPALNVLVTAAGKVDTLLADLPVPVPAIRPGTLMDVAGQLEAFGILDEHSLAAHTGVPAPVALSFLLAEYTFTGRTWENPATYYRGRAHEKARLAETVADDHSGPRRQALLDQAQKLRDLAPWKDLMDMVLEARDPLIPEQVLADWVNVQLGTCVAVKRNTWDRAGEPTNLIQVARGEYGVQLRIRNSLDEALALAERQAVDAARVRALEAYLNFKTPVDPVVNQDVKSEAQISAERHAHQQKAVRLERELAAHFRSWVLASEHTHAVELALNDGRYGLLSPEPDMRPLTLPEYQGPVAHPFQAGHVRTAARMDGVLFDFGVGLGKTLSALMLAALLRQGGRARLPAIVVPLSRLGDWVMNAATALPGLRTLVIGGEPVRNTAGQILLDEDNEPRVKEDTGEQRRKKVASLLTDAPDLVIFSFEAFEAIPMLEDTRLRFVQGDATLMSGLANLTTFDDRSRKLSGHRELVSAEKFTQRHLGRVRVSTPTDVPFEALGIDAVIWDEVHGMKNTYAAPAVYGDSTPKFLGGGGESNRALDANHKARFIRERGGCTVGLSATWFTNSPLEIYNMLSLVTDVLPQYGISNVQAFTARFCVIEPRLITLPEGDVEFRSCVVGFRNLDELRAIIAQHVIRETEDTCRMHDRVGMNLPPLTTVEHLFDLAPEVQALYDAEVGNLEFVEDQGENHLFAIFARLLKLTLHPPLMKVQAPNARFAACVEACVAARQQGGRNVVFMYTGGPDGLTYRALKAMLVAAGYPEREIEIVTASTHKTAGERLNVERRFRRGELSCVIGSSVIEQGGNFQGGTDLHHLDYPHHHMAFVQRIGRARRQGTWVSEVRNHVYFARGSFDVIRFQNMLGKKGWSEQVFDPSLLTCENTDVGFDGEELAVMLARDPQAMRSLIRARKADRDAASRQATLLSDLGVIREFLDALKLLQTRWRTAQGREKGPSVHDVAGINRLVTSLRGLAAQVEALRSAGNPLAAVTRLKETVTWVEGLPIHKDMTLTVEGVNYRVRSVLAGPSVSVLRVDSGAQDVLDSARLATVRDVLPTPDEAAYGDEAITRLPQVLQVRILGAEVKAGLVAEEAAAVAVTRPPVVESAPMQEAAAVVPPRPAPPVPRAAQRPPLGLRYGLTVAQGVGAAGQVYAIQGDTLVPGERPGCASVVVEFRGERDVRLVTLVLPDEPLRARTRELLRRNDPRLRLRVNGLLASL